MAATKSKAGMATVVEELLAGYRRQPRTHRVDSTYMPSHPECLEILRLCFQVLFPGYFGAGDLTAENVRYRVGDLLATLKGKLVEQINRCLCYEQSHGPASDCPKRPAECRRMAERVARGFLARLPGVRELLNLDVEAAYDGDPAAKSFDEVIFCYPGFMAVMAYRIAHALLDLGVPLMPRMMTEAAHSLTGVDIHPGARIGKRFFIDHGTGVVIGETTVIGDNVKLYQGVTLGALSFPKDRRGRLIKGLQRHPTLKDNVVVYANATILGGQTVIGKGVTVGGNTFVTSSVDANSLVSMKPPELHTRPKKRGRK